jgi:hypothetical protein
LIIAAPKIMGLVGKGDESDEEDSVADFDIEEEIRRLSISKPTTIDSMKLSKLKKAQSNSSLNKLGSD